jgi:hypothetical protein
MTTESENGNGCVTGAVIFNADAVLSMLEEIRHGAGQKNSKRWI